MSNQYWTAACWVILVSVFLVAGCERGHDRQEEPIEYNPLADANVVIADYASGAIDAAGGRRAWMEAKKLVFHGVVTFYRHDGSFYLTEQRHELRPWLNSVQISASEPQGRFVWQLSKGDFSTLEGADRAHKMPIKVCEPYFARAILDIVTVPARLADLGGASAIRSAPVKLEGQWYYRIEAAGSYWYQRTDTFLVDAILYVDSGREGLVAVRGYDYREVRKGGVRVPTKIEVFNAAADGSVKERLAQVDYYSLNQG
ncbi:MAG: hypothetical protein ACYSUV_01395 [Planctomycetota bacterium]